MSTSGQQRIVSMDQFRGYTVAGMFLVNFLGGYEAVHAVFMHNDNYFSYADSIMPSFMFACGFSYRLTALKLLGRGAARSLYLRFITRSLGLVLVSLMMYGFGMEFKLWSEITPQTVHEFLYKLIKANLWEVLAIIGVAQLLILPVIARRPSIRALTMIGFVLAHLVLTYLFNFNYVYGLPNAVDATVGVPGSTAWDGGLFGLLQWAAMILAGSLAYDLVSTRTPGRSGGTLLTLGLAAMAVGYALSCLSLLYDGEKPEKGNIAASPVWPPLERLSSRPWKTMLAEPPFVKPPGTDQRPNNYWMMNKHVTSITFVLCATGFAAALYGLFVLALDPGGTGLGLFRTFGQNALAAYVLHHMVETQIHTIVPKNSPLWYCLLGLGVFYLITYVFVRFLEKQGVYIRL